MQYAHFEYRTRYSGYKGISTRVCFADRTKTVSKHRKSATGGLFMYKRCIKTTKLLPSIVLRFDSNVKYFIDIWDVWNTISQRVR